MRHTITALIAKRETHYVAQCSEVEVVAQGKTLSETISSLKQAIALFLEREDPSRLNLVTKPMLLVTFQPAPGAHANSTAKLVVGSATRLPASAPRQVRRARRSGDRSSRAAQTRSALAEILAGDLGFHDESSSYASHTLHAFAAKFPPQLPRVFVERLTQRGDRVLDPMMGSGTALVEAALLGRQAIGVDIDPLALRLCRVKTTPLRGDRLIQAAESAVLKALTLLMEAVRLRDEIVRRFDSDTRAFLDYWFLPQTQRELMALVMSIEGEPDVNAQEFLRLVFSSIIITKSGGVSRARDLAHSRPHRVLSKKPRNAVEQFELRARKAAAAVNELPAELPPVELHRGDARDLPLPDLSVDLVITSPPYANAIDYMRAHKFSLVWLGEAVGRLSELRSSYIGSENCRDLAENDLPAVTAAAIRTLAARDPRKARILEKYFADMKRVLAEILRVLRPGSAAGIVVGPSTMRGLRTETHEHLGEIAEDLGFDLVGIAERKLDRDRRMMPARLGKPSINGIEQRMHEEFVIGLVRP